MNKANRTRLLKLANWFDRRARQIRAYTRAQTPKRGTRTRQPPLEYEQRGKRVPRDPTLQVPPPLHPQDVSQR
jgi:hypothetical protein